MTQHDECAAQRLRAADKLIKETSELSFAAETIAGAALQIANGDEVHAEYLLSSLENLVATAIQELQKSQRALPFLIPLGRAINSPRRFE